MSTLRDLWFDYICNYFHWIIPARNDLRLVRKEFLVDDWSSSLRDLSALCDSAVVNASTHEPQRRRGRGVLPQRKKDWSNDVVLKRFHGLYEHPGLREFAGGLDNPASVFRHFR